jgi:cell division protein FtsI/penicillin-binding protein 2
MFERRLKIFLLFLVLATIVLLSRAVQVQVVDQSYWTQRAAGLLQRGEKGDGNHCCHHQRFPSLMALST